MDAKTAAVDQAKGAIETLVKSGLKINQNNRRELMALIMDIGGRAGIEVKDVLDTTEIRSILQDPAMNGPQKLAAVKEVLVYTRYPVFAKARSVFHRKLARAGLRPKVKVTPAPYFENTSLRVEFVYDSPRELREIIAELERLAEEDPVRDALAAAEDTC